ncbi:hypothetical protein NQ117_08610 [Paenibacillus sp. SC116]|uniref:hypothetical protein n=1 Tax=Paenibacillus sp. SC116 TaxID=2968986 RepID=UPI00215A7E89|nr:hypothetical protein [Paenibacillus sp. SC116]MCR8843747.1 hypothetical protein [Paenibacillus sp. SC116]
MSRLSNNFKVYADEVIAIVESNINNLQLFSNQDKKILNNFAELDVVDEEERIQILIISVYTRFQGKVDFRNTDNPKNEKLKKEFITELRDIKSLLQSF